MVYSKIKKYVLMGLLVALVPASTVYPWSWTSLTKGSSSFWNRASLAIAGKMVALGAAVSVGVAAGIYWFKKNNRRIRRLEEQLEIYTAKRSKMVDAETQTDEIDKCECDELREQNAVLESRLSNGNAPRSGMGMVLHNIRNMVGGLRSVGKSPEASSKEKLSRKYSRHVNTQLCKEIKGGIKLRSVNDRTIKPKEVNSSLLSELGRALKKRREVIEPSD